MATEYRRRTAITRLDVSAQQAALLSETITEWLKGCQLAADIGWESEVRSKADLQSMAYDRVRESTDLKSQHAILGVHQAADALSSVAERRESGHEVSKPVFSSRSMQFDERTMTVFDDGEVSLSTVSNRVRCKLRLPSETDGYQQKFLNSDEWELATSTLKPRGGEYYLHLGFRKPIDESSEEPTPENKTVLGVDLGIENIAVTSTAHFESGNRLRAKHRQFERIRGDIQRTGTRSAHLTLEQRERREKRYTRDELHKISRAIVEEASSYGCNCIALEDLEYIRESLPSGKEFHQWAHRKLVQFIEYKANEEGLSVVFVDPAYTSRQCSECGHEAADNRKTRQHFHCQNCGGKANADYNAAKNIGLAAVRCGQQSPQRTGHGQLALKSGTVTPNEGFTPYTPSAGIEAENTDKSRCS